MPIKVKLPPDLSEKYGEYRELTVPSKSIPLLDFITLVAEQEWGQRLLEGGRIKSPYALVIDNELVLLKDNPEMDVGEKSDVRFLVFLTGG